MSTEALARRTVLFVNIAHALDHFLLLIYPTAVIVIAAETGLTYAALIALATGAFVAFGLFSLPIGWLADRYGRRNLLALFFAGCGLACLGLASAGTPAAFAGWLFVLGVFTAIYHPIGSAMLVTHASRLGRDLGWNGVWGNLGAAWAPAVTAVVATAFGWRAAFIIPGIGCLAAGVAFVAMVPGDGEAQDRDRTGATTAALARPLLLVGIFAVAIMSGGMTFNIATIALPKIIDERLGLDLPLVVTGSLATGVFVFGALTQLLMGRLIDRYELPTIFVNVILQGFADIVGKTAELLCQGLELQPRGRAWNAAHEPEIGAVKGSPVGRDILLEPCRDHLRDVAPVQRDPLPDEGQRPSFGLHLGGQALELGRPRHKRREIEAEGGLDRTALPFPGVALAVRTIPPDHQAAIDQGCQVPPEGRGRHAMRAQGELIVRRKHDQIIVTCQSGLRMEGQQGVQHR